MPRSIRSSEASCPSRNTKNENAADSGSALSVGGAFVHREQPWYGG